MNKAMKKIMMALVVTGALCTTAMAAPKGNHIPNGKAPVAIRAQAPKSHQASPAKHTVKEPPKAHHAPAKNAHHHEVAKHKSPPPPVKVKHSPPPPPPHEKVCHHKPDHHKPNHHKPNHHHSETLHTEDWCCIGATVVGGIIGGLIGAAM